MNNLDRRVLGLLLTEPRVPTRREMATELHVSTDTIQRSVYRLEDEGFITRVPNRSRALECVALP